MITRILAYFRARRIARQRMLTEQWQAAYENHSIEPYRLHKEAEEAKLAKLERKS